MKTLWVQSHVVTRLLQLHSHALMSIVVYIVSNAYQAEDMKNVNLTCVRTKAELMLSFFLTASPTVDIPLAPHVVPDTQIASQAVCGGARTSFCRGRLCKYAVTFRVPRACLPFRCTTSRDRFASRTRTALRCPVRPEIHHGVPAGQGNKFPGVYYVVVVAAAAVCLRYACALTRDPAACRRGHPRCGDLRPGPAARCVSNV